MNYTIVDKEKYYRKGVYRHFSEDCKCSVSITARIDVTELYRKSKATDTKFYLNFLYILCKTLNSREDYRMGYLWQTDTLVCYDKINSMDVMEMEKLVLQVMKKELDAIVNLGAVIGLVLGLVNLLFK